MNILSGCYIHKYRVKTNMKLKINGEEIELIYSFRANVYFEQITGHAADFSNINSNDLITLFYCNVISSLQKAKKPTISMVDFLDVVDENDGEKCILDFSNWYVKVIQAQYEILESTEETKEENTIKPSKKK